MDQLQKDEQQEVLAKNRYFNYPMIRRGALIFLAITLAAFTILFLYTNTEETITSLKNIDKMYLLLVLGLVLMDWILGAYRNHIFVRKVIPDISFWVTFNANLANIFMGAVTPSQTGGGPMHLYMLNRGGVKLADGIVLSIINFISTILFLVASAGSALYYMRDSEMNDKLYILIQSGFSIFTTLFVLIFAGLIAPAWISKGLVKAGAGLAALLPKYRDKILKGSGVASAKLHEYNQTIVLFVKKHPTLLPASMLVTSLLYFNKYLIGYFLAVSLGFTPDFWMVMAIHAILTFLLYFAPSPGGSGIAEVSISVLMGQIIPMSGIASFTILQRFCTMMLPAAIGAVVVLKELGKHSRE